MLTFVQIRNRRISCHAPTAAALFIVCTKERARICSYLALTTA